MLDKVILEENQKIKIALVDNDEGFVDAYNTILTSYGYKVFPFYSPDEALEKLKSSKCDILICNYLLYPYNADSFIEKIREFDKNLYILLVTAHKDIAPPVQTMHDLDIQAYFEKGASTDQFIMMLETAVKNVEQIREIQDVNKLLKQNYFEFAEVLKNTVEAKDKYTKGHSDRVAEYAEMIGNHLNLSEKDNEILRVAGTFHDIGKIGIPDSILLKPAKLTASEYEVIKKHPNIGYEIMNSSLMLKDILPYIKHHHERIDGHGYPDRLKGEEIPYLARILAVCDTFDALTSDRAYRKGMDINEAIKIMKSVRGTQLDTKITNEFISMVKNDKESFIKE